MHRCPLFISLFTSRVSCLLTTDVKLQLFMLTFVTSVDILSHFSRALEKVEKCLYRENYIKPRSRFTATQNKH